MCGQSDNSQPLVMQPDADGVHVVHDQPDSAWFVIIVALLNHYPISVLFSVFISFLLIW